MWILHFLGIENEAELCLFVTSSDPWYGMAMRLFKGQMLVSFSKF